MYTGYIQLKYKAKKYIILQAMIMYNEFHWQI